MATKSDVKRRIKAFFNAPVQADSVTAFSDDETTPDFARSAQKPFSVFDPSTITRRTELMRAANAALANADDPTEGLDAAMQVFEEAARQGDLALAQHVLGVFAVHAPKLRSGTPAIPVPPMAFRRERGAIPFGDDDDEEGEGVSLPAMGEDRLHYWREDLYLNEHHRHWHFVYDTSGFPEPGRIRLKSRQGEVFIYMHKQMLARYETERLAAGLPLTEPLTDYSDTLGVGYDPDAREPRFLGYGARPDNETLSAAHQADLNARRTAYRNFLSSGGQIAGRTLPLTASTIGSALESNLAFGTDEIVQQEELNWIAEATHGLHLHNLGHGHIAALGAGQGVMTNPHTSLQDPVFWRWHRMIDDLAEEYYATLLAHAPTDTGIGMNNDLIVVLSEVAGADFSNQDRGALRKTLLRDAATELNEGRTGANLLHTGMIDEEFQYNQGNSTRQFRRASLFTERFAVVARASSTLAQAATARLFLCADRIVQGDEAHLPEQQHRYWIELDRKAVSLEAGETDILFLADESSVVRKIGGTAPWPTSSFTAGGFDDLHDRPGNNDDFCDCGWPLSLLLPRGTEAGMGFQLMVHVSPGSPGASGSSCGSRAFCGARFDSYPELAEINLGYPFDRPAAQGTLAMIDAAPDMARRSLTIQHAPNLPDLLGMNVS
ncbi:hypothetical protein FMN63_11440 [Stappia sp. BW2]|uniref:tyrosinase family protein n=1 Tax=Stappia sp. BW2 TaxID=2592622 RepID=UPI0011DEAA3F|nr:tyrosinase family protein [Stappia sp. BW2]TYC68289.1 hypothetical protein FMN63_11440 [Stappia sp. BW2]